MKHKHNYNNREIDLTGKKLTRVSCDCGKEKPMKRIKKECKWTDKEITTYLNKTMRSLIEEDFMGSEDFKRHFVRPSPKPTKIEKIEELKDSVEWIWVSVADGSFIPKKAQMVNIGEIGAIAKKINELVDTVNKLLSH